MKQVGLVLLLVAFEGSFGATLSKDYLPPKVTPSFAQINSIQPPTPNGAFQQEVGPLQQGFVSTQQVSNRFQASKGPEVKILRLESDVRPDGYNYGYATDDGTQAEESGQLNGENLEAQGSFKFIAPDGSEFSVIYTAGENGFLPQGAHLPTAPPIPAEILKALEQNAADEARGIVDDGQYHPEANEGGSNGGVGVIANKGQVSGGYKY